MIACFTVFVFFLRFSPLHFASLRFASRGTAHAVTWRTWRRGDHSKASLGRRKGAALVALYVVVLSVYAAINFT